MADTGFSPPGTFETACRAGSTSVSGHELVSFDPDVRIGQQRIKGLREDPDRIATVNFDRHAATVHEKP